MDFQNNITEFVSDKIGGITIISEANGEIVYADEFYTKKYGNEVTGMVAEEVYLWLGDCPDLSASEGPVEWESIDIDTKKYYRIHSGKFEKEGTLYQIHQMTDVTEYMDLNRDITKYMSFFKKLSAFQTAVLEKLSSTYYELLPMLSDYFVTSKVYCMIQREGNVDIITYSKIGSVYSNDRIELNGTVGEAFLKAPNEDIGFTDLAPAIQEVLALTGSTEESVFRLLCGGAVSGQKYAIYLSIWPNTNLDAMKEKTLLSVIQLYLENGIMREKLIYESEHDRLTGLYNKGKYLSMVEQQYANMDSIAIFNFDVNNLKVMNDNYGHEAGDKLLIKAANSIRKVTNNKVHGYRMGGDEFLMIACDVSEQDASVIKDRWEKELERLNTLEDDIHCVIAVGIACGSKGYDFAALMKEADQLMYEDKKRKKKPGEEIR